MCLVPAYSLVRACMLDSKGIGWHQAPGWFHLKCIINLFEEKIWCLNCHCVVIFFLAATKQLYEWSFPSVCPSVCLSHLFDHVPDILSSWNFQEWSPLTKVRGLQTVKVRGQRSRSQRSWPHLAVSGLQLQLELTDGNEILHTAWTNIEEVPYCFSRSSIKFQGHRGRKPQGVTQI